jgi:putative transposase
VLERALEAELTAHFGYERYERAGRSGPGNYRNGTMAMTVQTGVARWAAVPPGPGPGRSSRCWCPSRPGESPTA